MLPSRRQVLAVMGVATSVFAARRAHRQEAAPARPAPTESRNDAATPAVLRPGMRFFTSTVAAVGASEFGAIPITLVDTRGESFRVDVLRHDPAAPGVARAGSLSVYMCNNGGGSARTHEDHGIAAMEIAAHLARCEAAGMRPPSLLTLAQRESLRCEMGYPEPGAIAAS